MDGIAILLAILIIVVFFLLISINQKASRTQDSIDSLRNKLEDLLAELHRTKPEISKQKSSEEKSAVDEAKPLPKVDIPAPVFVPKRNFELEEKNYHNKPPAIEPVPVLINVAEETDERAYKEESKSKSGKDLERFIGENLANKIGIAVLVLGISFFVKYAIDKDWINETGRVIIGLVSGGILLGLAHYIRNNYRSFSSVLIGGGLTVFYFTIAYAFHSYHLVGQQAAFIIMVVITAMAVLLSLYYDRQELAILATIGGFITPFLVSTGQENYIALFIYLAILNSGLIVLSWFKRWPSINTIALVFSTIIYGGWLVRRSIFLDAATLPYKDALLFATIFYVQFMAMHITNNIRLKRKFVAFDYIIVLSTNFLYYLSGLFLLINYNEGYKGLFTLCLAAFNFLLAVIFYRKKTIDAGFISVLIALTLSYLSLTPLVQLKGNHIALFWAAEMPVLYWLYQRSKLIHLRIASIGVGFLLLACLVYNWAVIYLNGTTIIPILANKGFITTISAAASFFICYVLLRREKADEGTMNNTAFLRDFSITSALIIAYSAGAWETWYQFITRYPEIHLYSVYLQCYSFAYTAIVLILIRRSPYYSQLKFLLTALCFALYISNLHINYDVSIELVNSDISTLFIAHWVAAIILSWLLYDLGRYFFVKAADRWADYRPAFAWVSAASIILLISVEMYHVMLWTNYRSGDWEWWENLYYKAGLTILWSICSFTMMWIGMKTGFRTLRIISLTLFSFTIIKLFAYDIRNIPPGGKIAAFILLGILLLTVSFMYQRLKKIIIDDSGERNG